MRGRGEQGGLNGSYICRRLNVKTTSMSARNLNLTALNLGKLFLTPHSPNKYCLLALIIILSF
jgi:hypothetical protein